MKKLIVLGVVAALVMGLAVSASAFTIIGQPSPNGGGNATLTNASNSNSPYNNPNGNQIFLLLVANLNWNGGSDPGTLYSIYGRTTWTENMTFTYAMFADSVAANPQATLTFWIPQAAGLTDGKIWRFYNKLTKEEYWRGAMNTAKSTSSNYWFRVTIPTAGHEGPANSMALGLEIVPEPGSVVAMLTGVVGFAGYAIRRRK